MEYKYYSFLYYIPKAVSPPSLPPSPSFHLPSPPDSAPPPAPLRKEQVSQGHQPNTAQQAPIRPGTCCHIKAERGNPAGGRGSQAAESGTAQALIVRISEHQTTLYAEDLPPSGPYRLPDPQGPVSAHQWAVFLWCPWPLWF